MTRISKILNDCDVYEMANLDDDIHGLPIKIKMNILQPGDKKIPHAPRIKIFRGSSKKGDKKEFSLSLLSEPKIEAGIIFLNKKEFNLVLKFVKNNYKALLKFWNDSDMTTKTLKELLK